jgi:hypothetical protein
MSDTIIIMMRMTADEETNTSSRTISRSDEMRTAQFDFIGFEFDQLSAPLKDMAIQLLDDRYDGPVIIYVESRDGDRVFKNQKTVLNSEIKKIVLKETMRHGLLPYGYQQEELKNHLIDLLFDEASKPVKESLKEDLKNQ